MKLLNKTNRAYLILVSLIFPLMILADYFLIVYLVNREVNELLTHERQRIEYHMGSQEPSQSSDYVFSVEQLTSTRETHPSKYRDTLIYDAMRDQMVPYRLYEFSIPQETGQTRVVLRHILLEPQALIVWLFAYTALIMFLLALGIFFINQRIYRWAFRPFFSNLNEIKNYDLRDKKKVHWEPSDIDEFQELYQTVNVLMNRVEEDYENLKELNENIAHEVQTPLAVIQNKAVYLMDSAHIGEEDRKQIEVIYSETNRLSRIGKSLTLISRIQNQEFRRTDSIDIRELTLSILEDLKEMIQFRKLRVEKELEEVVVQGDRELFRILLTNLIKNAIQHNSVEGLIRISLQPEIWAIYNSGPQLELPREKLFSRFSKSSSNPQGLGLGLAICKKIASLCSLSLEYDYDGSLHLFELRMSRDSHWPEKAWR